MIICSSLSCSYPASFRDCAISCSSASGCPDGFSCGVEGLCRASNVTASCGAILGDGGGPDGAPGEDAITPPDGLRDLVLDENTSTAATEEGASCFACGSNAAGSGFAWPLSWYREFSLTDFPEVSSTFEITTIHVGCSVSEMASITATVYSYTGPLFASSIDTGAMTAIGSASVQVQQSCPADDVAIPISVTQPIAAGAAFVVEIHELDRYADSDGTCGFTHEFRIGANGAGDSRRAYFASQCAPGSAPCCNSSPTQLVSTAPAPIIVVEGLAP